MSNIVIEEDLEMQKEAKSIGDCVEWLIRKNIISALVVYSEEDYRE